MNIYEKLKTAKTEFHKLKLTKSGVNKFAHYKYFELADFVKPIIKILDELDLVTTIRFAEHASLTLINCENPVERIKITCPLSVAEMKGCQAVQNLGAVMTYTRRYLFVNLFDIIESDGLDGTTGKPEPPKPKSKARLEFDKVLKLANDEVKANAKARKQPKANMTEEELIEMTKILKEEIDKYNQQETK